ncbi:MAG: DNA-binding protein [Thermoprotei archaeon]|nr:winged helix-turn-helix transcriptional regulator [Thermoproteales archaeon]RLE76719.1 MAG: DNA-binding protein [Thermoprotei archaeon]RLE76793.1 MAG: DNA-binding protein [Thermoprotei archaeon]RLE85009.1 MAG: DNA-binding protein [Thermoprotei archaeon]
MPRNPTSRILDRKKKVYEFIKSKRETTTTAIVNELGLSHSQVFYILRLLLKEGFIEEIKRGKIAFWRVRK